MKQRFKILSMVMVIVTVLMCTAMPIQAAVVQPDVEPMWDNTNTIIIGLSFPNNGCAEASVCGKTGVTQITIDICVYRQSGNSWIYVTEAHKTVTNKMTCALGCQFTPINGAYYRADFTFTITKGGVDEIIEKTKYKTCEQ